MIDAYIVVRRFKDREEATTIPLTLERTVATLRDQVAFAGRFAKCAVAFEGEGAAMKGCAGEIEFYIEPAYPTAPEAKTLTISVAKRLRERGVLLPVGDGQQYETPALKRIAMLQTVAMMQMDQLDEELRGL
jgi:xanthine/CO dehydrogenase XdhC/CoxF family maturation factor